MHLVSPVLVQDLTFPIDLKVVNPPTPLFFPGEKNLVLSRNSKLGLDTKDSDLDLGLKDLPTFLGVILHNVTNHTCLLPTLCAPTAVFQTTIKFGGPGISKDVSPSFDSALPDEVGEPCFIAREVFL